MNKKLLSSLVVVSIVLLGVYFLSQESNKNIKSAPVLPNVEWSKLSKLVLEKEGVKLELSLDKSSQAINKWVVASQSSYPASSSSVNGLMFKLMDLSGSQSVDLTDAGLSRLGLTDDSKSAGQGIITLFGQNGEEVEQLYLGGLRNRKNTTVEETLALSGQYVRKKSTGKSYLLALPINAQTTASAWLDTEILSIPSSMVYKVTAARAAVDSSYGILRTSALTAEGKPEFSLKEKAPANKEIDKLVFDQITSGLEDLKLENVFPSNTDSPELSDMKFLPLLTYELVNGLVYKITGGDKGEKSYITVSVEYNDSLADEAIAVETKELEGKTVDPKKPKILKSSKEEAEKLQAGYVKWKYEVPKYVYSRFSKNRDNLFKDIVTPAAK